MGSEPPHIMNVVSLSVGTYQELSVPGHGIQWIPVARPVFLERRFGQDIQILHICPYPTAFTGYLPFLVFLLNLPDST
jgi:hypothetical protein